MSHFKTILTPVVTEETGFADLRFFRTLNDHVHSAVALSTSRHACACIRQTRLLSHCCTTFYVKIEAVCAIIL